MASDRTVSAATAGVETTTTPQRTAHRYPWPVVLLGGLLGGLAWGIFARAWMRFISTDPEFTWNGTLFIVIGFGIVGLSQAGAYLGRRAGFARPRMTVLRVVTFAGLLPLGVAAGGQMFPTVVLAPLALTHTRWPRWARLLVGALALVPVSTVAAGLFRDLPTLRAAVGCLWFLVVYAGLVWAARFTLAPQLDTAADPGPMELHGSVPTPTGHR